MRFAAACLLALTVFAGCSDPDSGTVTSLQLAAPGMHCDGCTATVEETLMKMDGVDSVRADLGTKDVFVRVDTARSSRAALEEMIGRLGFAEAPDGE